MCEGESRIGEQAGGGGEPAVGETGDGRRDGQTSVVGVAVTGSEVVADGVHVPFDADTAAGSPDSYNRDPQFTEAYVL